MQKGNKRVVVFLSVIMLISIITPTLAFNGVKFAAGKYCPLGQYMYGYDDKVYCSTPASGPGSSVEDDLAFNFTKSWTMFEPFTNNGAIETGEVGLYGWNYAATGGSVTVNTPYKGNHPGVIRLSTGSSAVGNASMDLGITTIILDGLAGNLTGMWMVNLSHSPTDAENFTLYLGFHDSTGTTRIPTDGIYFMANLTWPNWTAVVSANSVRTYNDTNIPITGHFEKITIKVINQSTYRSYFYIDDTLVATIGGTHPMGTSRTFGTAAQIYKTGGTTARTMDIDYYYFKQEFQQAR